MEKAEILTMINNLKDKIVTLKQENTSLKTQYEQLKVFSDSVNVELEKIRQQNGVYQSDIQNLQNQLAAIQEQSQQNAATEETAKEAFMSEITRALEEANKALED